MEVQFRKQLFAGLGALVALITTMAAIGIFALHAISGDEGALTREYADDVAVVERLRFLAEHLVATSRGYLLSGDASLLNQFEEGTREVEDALRDLRGRHRGSPRIAELDRTAHDYIAAASSAVRQRTLVGHPDLILPMYESTLVPRRELDAELTAMARDRRVSFERALRSSHHVARSAELALVLASILAIACGITLAVTVSKRLSRAAAAREEVLAVVSHDLRNPLYAITMATALVDETSREPATRRYTQTIHNAAQRMHHMIEELLEATKLEAGRIEVHSEPVSIRELVDRTIDLFQTRARERGVSLTYEVPEGRAMADRERAIEILSNLVGNALKFTPRGGHVTVNAQVIGEAVRFSVTDDGPGIPRDQLPHLFERYWQGDRRHEQGLGLGLYICDRLVEAHHGNIGVESELGKGTTVWFTLPVSLGAKQTLDLRRGPGTAT